MPPATQLVYPLCSGDTVATVIDTDFLPMQNWWKGVVDNEIILFAGTSGGNTGSGSYVFVSGGYNLSGCACPDGGMLTLPSPPQQSGFALISGSYSISIIQRGIDGTIQTCHSEPATIHQVVPNNNYGANLITVEKMQFTYPSVWTSGGIKGGNLVPQTQTVFAFTNVGICINGLVYYSGIVATYDPSQQSGFEWIGQELVWLKERSEGPITSGRFYGGQLVGYSAGTLVGSTFPGSCQ
jgi:hypothetical protein